MATIIDKNGNDILGKSYLIYNYTHMQITRKKDRI